MKKTQNLKRWGIAALTTTILAGGFLPNSSYAAEKDSTNLVHFESNMPESAKKLSIIDTETSGKEYLTDVEVKTISPYKLNAIYEELEGDIQNGKYSEEELNQIVAEKIKSKRSVVRAFSYEIPGFDKLTDAEVNLAKQHPVEFVTYASCSVQAKSESEKYYGESQLTQGNGDAFRHSYWNAILLKGLAGSKGRDYGDGRAKAWTDAHEQNSWGIDKEMDLHNNWFGRMATYNNYGWSNPQLSNHLRGAVRNGSMARIVNEQLVRTNGETGK
ncbi:hypothetical protein V7024_23865 [Bacillus sp. JJ864]|uniref:DUF6973 domain-containing protein n=1 Tax=Bacillus sp. JJ864 TaxID=3122975 RepID=UPI002FFDE0F2